MTILIPDTAEVLVRRLDQLRPDSCARWGKMNANQMVCHLSDSFALAMGAKTASEQITLFSRTVLRWAALRMPMPSPKDVPTRPEMDQLQGGTPPAGFIGDSRALASTIRRFARKPYTFRFGRHPIFGKMSEWEWMRWGWLHADHHFRQFGV